MILEYHQNIIRISTFWAVAHIHLSCQGAEMHPRASGQGAQGIGESLELWLSRWLVDWSAISVDWSANDFCSWSNLIVHLYTWHRNMYSESAMDRNCWPPTQNGFSSQVWSHHGVPSWILVQPCPTQHLQVAFHFEWSTGAPFCGSTKGPKQEATIYTNEFKCYIMILGHFGTRLIHGTGPQQEMGCTVLRMICFDSQEKTNRLLRSIWCCQSWASPQRQYGGPDRIIAWRQTGMLPLGGGLWIAGICWDDVQRTLHNTSYSTNYPLVN